MTAARALSTASLLRARASARRGLLASAIGTVAVAVATVCTLLALLVLESGSTADATSLNGPSPQTPGALTHAPGLTEDELVAQVEEGVVALISAAPALVLLVVILAATAAAQLARLLAAAREQESGNARARGLSRGQATIADAFEAAVVALVGAVLGLAVATAVSAAATGGASAATVLAVLELWWTAVVTAALLGAVLVVAARRRSSASARGARATTSAAVALVLLAAAFAVWQLRLARPSGFDPIVAIAPTVVLMAGAILVLAVFGVGAAAATIPTAARQGLAPSYPVRQVARRLPIYAIAVLLVGLTVAQAVFASAYGATWVTMATQSAALRAGTDLRVDMNPSSASPERVAEVAAVDGVTAVAPALAASTEFGGTVAELVSVAADAIDEVVVGGQAERTELRDAVEGDPIDTVGLGEGATGIRLVALLTVPGSGPMGALQFTATVVDATGTADTIRLARAADDVGSEPVAVGGSLEVGVQATLPAGTAPWRLLALTADRGPAFFASSVDVELVDVQAIGGAALEVSGSVTLDEETPVQHLWLAGGVPAEPPAVPAVVSASFADRLGVQLGDRIEFRYAGTGRRGEIAVTGVAEVIPGAAEQFALFADLRTLQLSMLQHGSSIVAANSIWAAGDPAIAPEVSRALGDSPVATAAPSVTAAIVGALVPGWWIATIGSAVLSLIAAFAIVQTLSLARRREVGVLRALGVTGRDQARMRAAELAVVLGSAVVLGAAAGLLVSWLIVTELIRAVTPGILPLAWTISFAWPGLIILGGGLVLGLVAIIAVATASVRGAARTATVGDESS